MEINNTDIIEEISVSQLLILFWKQKFIIVISTILITFFAIIYAVSLPNIYTAKSILSPVELDSGFNQSIQGYSGLASLAGISLPSATGSKSKEAAEVLLSHKFFSKKFLPNIKLENLMALKSWDIENNVGTYHEDDFNPITGKWIRDADYPMQPKPSSQEAHEVFQQIFSISENKENGFFTLTIDHQSPTLSSSWLEILIKEINKDFRSAHKEEATTAINFLNDQISSTNLTEIKEALSQLLKSETQKLMLIEANEDYVFKVLEPPFPPEQKTSPSRLLIILIGIFLGIFFGITLAFFRICTHRE